jgi:hypothetical protein
MQGQDIYDAGIQLRAAARQLYTPAGILDFINYLLHTRQQHYVPSVENNKKLPKDDQ